MACTSNISVGSDVTANVLKKIPMYCGKLLQYTVLTDLSNQILICWYEGRGGARFHGFLWYKVTLIQVYNKKTIQNILLTYNGESGMADAEYCRGGEPIHSSALVAAVLVCFVHTSHQKLTARQHVILSIWNTQHQLTL